MSAPKSHISTPDRPHATIVASAATAAGQGEPNDPPLIPEGDPPPPATPSPAPDLPTQPLPDTDVPDTAVSHTRAATTVGSEK